MIHVLAHLGISDSGQCSAEWTFDFLDCPERGCIGATRRQIARDLALTVPYNPKTLGSILVSAIISSVHNEFDRYGHLILLYIRPISVSL